MKTQFTLLRRVFIHIFALAFLLATMVLGLPFDPVTAQETNWALQFDGNSDFVTFDTADAIIGSNWKSTKSVSLWVKPEADNTCESYEVATCPNIFGDKPHWWGISIGSHTPDPPDPLLTLPDRIWVWNYDHVGDAWDAVGIPYTPGEWVNITLVHEGGYLSGYKNGVLAGRVSSSVTAPEPPTNTGNLSIGGLEIINFFAGQIDEVSIWDIGLSAPQIRASMYNGLGGNETGLRAYYKMSDGPPSLTLMDDSQYNWTGTLMDQDPLGSGPLWVDRGEVTPPETPLAPSDLTASQANFSQVNLSWHDNSTNEFSFEIERCTGASCNDFGWLVDVIDNVTTYTDTNVVQGTTYCYRVRAANIPGHESAYTNTACATVYIPLYLPMILR